MIRLAISVEGETEEELVKRFIAKHLRTKGIEPQPILLKGNVSIDRLSNEIAKLVASFDYVSSLVDFYGFSNKGDLTITGLEQRIAEAVSQRIHGPWNKSRVICYVLKACYSLT